MTYGVVTVSSAVINRLHQFPPAPQATTRSNIGCAGSVSVTKTVSNGQSDQYLRHSDENGDSRSAYLSQEQIKTVQSELVGMAFMAGKNDNLTDATGNCVYSDMGNIKSIQYAP
jgi:hypothetical protein